MVGLEQEAIAFAVKECAMNGTELVITGSDGEVVWKIEPDIKVDEDDLTWPVIVHMRGALGSDMSAIVREVAATQEP